MRDATTRAEIASLYLIKSLPQRLQDADTNWTRFAQMLCSDGGGCLESDGETDQWKAVFERNSYSGVAPHEQDFPRHHHHSHRHAYRAIRICSLHTIGRLIRLRVRESPQ
jgi:hypothetical protein